MPGVTSPPGRGAGAPGPSSPRAGRVVGTAGHIDHGKSTLITALTGIDPDRLAEEKQRGMTIDLGFAHMRLPSGREIGIVDVPGHARFIRNMLAGVHGLDAVILVVAADEGVRPQTREHLEIIDLLDVRRGVVALTKADLVDPEWIHMVTGEVAAALEHTSLEGAPIIPVSAVTRAGLDELVAALDGLLSDSESRRDAGRPRLPVDRVFTMSGFGTVVTGTLVDGSLETGQELEVLPEGTRVRIRGLQQHNRKVETAGPGSRVAVNLSGVEKDDLERGDVLALPATLSTTRRVDAQVRVVPDAPRGLRHGAQLTLHTGTVEVGARAIVLEGDVIGPGSEGWVQLYLDRPIAAAEQDRFVLRVPSPSATIAGGRFADVAPRRHSRHDMAVRESLEQRAAGNVLQEELRKYPRGVTVSALLKATLAEEAGAGALDGRQIDGWIWAREHWAAQAQRMAAELAAYHSAHPLRAGIPREELRSRAGVPTAAFAAAVRGWVEDGLVVEHGAEVALASHRVAIEAKDGPAAKLLAELGRSPWAPPSLPEAKLSTGATDEMVRALERRGDLVRVSDEVAFTRDAYDSAVALVREMVAEGGSITVAQLRDRMGASRRPVLALLEHLDAQRVTRRVGDARVLR
jgi:selenocysteine-specific elongation factor